MSVGKDVIEAALEREVDESHLQIAKHELQGLDVGTIAEIFASDESEIREIVSTIEYKEVKRLVAIELAKYSADTDISWDSLEHKSLNRLHETIHYNNDPEFHLKVAVMANKATRRHRGNAEALNPAAAGVRVSLALTERFVQKLQQTAQGDTKTEERIVERKARIDLDNASTLRASPKQVMKFLSQRPEETSLEESLSEVGIKRAAA